MQDAKLLIIGGALAVLILGGVGYAVMHRGATPVAPASVATPPPADELPNHANGTAGSNVPTNELPSGAH